MDNEISRLVSLSVGTETAEEYVHVFQDISELARNLMVSYKYVTVSANIIDTEDDKPEGDPDGLYYDDKTLDKVRRALWAVLANKSEGLPASVITDMITEMQNEGIFFRERR